MRFEFDFYSSILLILFVNNLVFSFLLLSKGLKTQNKAYLWLALFIFLGCLYFAQWMLGFAGWYDNQPYRDFLFYMPMQHLFLLGPVIFFYIQSLLNPAFKITKSNFWHLVPGILYLVYALVIVIFDKIIYKGYYFLSDGMDRDYDSWYQYIGTASMVAYYGLTIRYYFLYKKLIVQITSNAYHVMFSWAKHLLLFIFIMLVLNIITIFWGREIFYFICSLLPNTDAANFNDYKMSWWYYFIFAVLIYYLAIKGYTNHIENSANFNLTLFPKPKALLLNFSPKIVNSTITTSVKLDKVINTANIEDIEIEIINPATANQLSKTEVLHWTTLIGDIIEKEKLYEDPELSLAQLAKVLNTTPSIISKAINQGFKQNFNDYINGLRINTLQQKLKAGEQKTQTIVSIAYDCGFNSKATFNRAFKKATNLSPSQWMQQEKIS